MSLLETARAKANHWLNSTIDPSTKEEIKKLLSSPDPRLLIDSFYKDLELAPEACAG